jgi:hypothetical protein
MAAMLEREIYRLSVAPILETENPGRGGQRQKRRNHQDQRTRKPSQGMAQSKDWHWPLRSRCPSDRRICWCRRQRIEIK